MDRRSWSLLAAILGSGIVFLDGTVVTVALPAIGDQLPRVTGIGVLEAQSYIFSGYMLSLSALLIVGGVLSDSWGRRRMYGWGLVGFAAASVLCGVAPNMELLIGGRVLQGVAGALLIPGSLALINGAYEGDDRARAFGIWTGASAAVTIVGPLVGGVLVDGLSWRAAFLVNLPVLALAWWVTTNRVQESAETVTGEPIDWWGAGLAGVGVAGLTFGPIRAQETEWQDASAWVIIVVGLFATALLVARIRRHPHALVPISLFANRSFNVINLATFFIYGALYVLLYMTSIYLQGTLGYNATAAGLATVPAMVPLVLFSGKIGTLSAHTGPRPWLGGGTVLMAAGAMWLAGLPSTSTAWEMGSQPASWIPPGDYFADVFGGILLFGIGLMVMVTPLTTALMASIAPERAGVGSAFNNAVSRIGPQLVGALAVVLVTAAFYGRLAETAPGVDVASADLRASVAPLNAPAAGIDPTLAEAARAASAVAFDRAMWLSAGLLLAGAAVSAVGLGREAEEGGSEGVRLGGQVCVPLEETV
jgi:EmrB/QacA subfamily drug resistance transporter